MKRYSFAFAAIASLLASCAPEQPLSSTTVHRATNRVQALQALAASDPHTVQRDATVTTYCVACHVGLDTGGHPLGVSLAAAATVFPGMFYNPPSDPAVVAVNGATVECTSCHDDGSAGFPKKTVAAELCNACHNKDYVPSDTIAPSVSIAPIHATAVAGTISVTATATDDVGVVRVQLWVGASSYAPSALVSTVLPTGSTVVFPFDTTTKADGTLYLIVRAYDAAWNFGEAFTTVTIDNTNPVVTITSPSPGALVGGTVGIATTTADAVARAELWVGGPSGTLVSSVVPTGTSFTLPFDTSAQPDGVAQLLVRVYDAAGNVGSAETAVTIDNTRPTVTIASPSSGALVRGTVEVAAAATGAIARAELWVGGPSETLVSSVVPTGSSFTFPFDTATHPDGIAQLLVRAYDPAGNVGTAETSLSIDNTPPEVAITAPADGSTVRGTVTIAAAASDGVGVTKVDFYVDGTLLATATSLPYSALWEAARKSALHVLTSVSTDVAGNVSTRAPVTVVAR